MNILSEFLSRAIRLADVEPIIALFLCAAILAVFLSALLPNKPVVASANKAHLPAVLYEHVMRLMWAAFLVTLLAGAISALRTYLGKTVSAFQRTHGRVTDANYNAVTTIWGSEQQQGELNVLIFNDEEVTERIESEDITKPAVLRKKMVRRVATGNPFISAHHDVTLRQNPRKKGSAFYGGYETECSFAWKLKNPADAAFKCNLTFPLPADGAMYDDITATLNGQDVLPQIEIEEGKLVLARDVAPNEAMELNIGFKSRGMSYWYFQVREPREIRDFTLTLNLPDLSRDKLDYPEGCMTPTDIQYLTNNTEGSLLTYRLDHALSNKGMGVALPKLPQPGETTNAVLRKTESAWLLIFAMLALALTLAGVRHAALFTILFSTATAFAYGLLGDFSDLLFGFWGTAALVLLPLFLILAWLVKRVARGGTGRWLALMLLVVGVVYPCLAGLDTDHQTLYPNLCGLVFLAFATRLLIERLAHDTSSEETIVQPA